MTHHRISQALAALILSSFAGMAAAAGTQQIDVSATVLTVCTFSPGTALSMTFADIDPSGTGNAVQTVNVPFKCTKGTADAAVTVTTGGTSLKNGADSMAYSISVGALPSGAGFASAATNVVVTGTIPDTSYRDAKALTYTDTVTLTINH